MRYAFGMLLSLAALYLFPTQITPRLEASPSVTISLPENIPSETVQIRYFITGPFGGYGAYIEPHRDLHSYQIIASTEGRPATAIKILVYAAGCRIQPFDLLLSQTQTLRTDFVCKRLPNVMLSGQLRSKSIREQDVELVITYMAFWANEFFGITDGFVPEFKLASFVPDENGSFRVEIPDFAGESTTSLFRSDESLHLMLRDSQTWNYIASIEPELSDFKSPDHGLKISASYPRVLNFISKLQQPHSFR